MKNSVLFSLIFFASLLVVSFYYLKYSKNLDLNNVKQLIYENLNETPNLKNLNKKDFDRQVILKKLDNFGDQLKQVFNKVDSVLNSNNVLLKKLEETVDKALANDNSNKKISSADLGEQELADIKKNLRLYDLKTENTNQFDCVKSANIVVQTTICIHDLNKDVFVSQSIKNNGAWEFNLVQIFMNILNSNKDMQVLDFGAQLGQFSLFAAKLGRKVIAVEPFYENYIRIHKSSQLESTTDNIILVTNGLSDHRGDLKKLHENNKNNGGQSIDDNQVLTILTDEQINADKYILRTIEMNDLVTIIPESFKEAIMKIDIEGYEIKAFKKASKLFSRVKVNAVFIEWMGKSDPTRFKDTEIEEFLEFMFSRGYVCKNPSGFNNLERNDWKRWPGDVIFTLKEFKLN